MEQHQFSFSRQLKALWRFKWMIVLVMLVAGGTALMATGQQPPAYTATVTMMIENNPNLALLPTGSNVYVTIPQDIVSQIEIMKSHDVLERAITQLEPDMASNPQQLELEIAQLKANLSIMQNTGTSLVGISVVAPNPAQAEQEAAAVANAYVYQIQDATQASIQTVLESTTKHMHELITSDVDLSNNPQLSRLTAQFNTAIPALQTAMGQLQQMSEKSGTPATQDAGTMITASQLDTLIQQVNDVTAEANEMAGLAGQLSLVSEEKDFTIRGANIAIIESRMRALNTKLGSLYSEVGGIEAVEIDAPVQVALHNVAEQLSIASATGGAMLDQVISLYGIQGQYRQAGTSATVDSSQIDINRRIGQEHAAPHHRARRPDGQFAGDGLEPGPANNAPGRYSHAVADSGAADKDGLRR